MKIPIQRIRNNKEIKILLDLKKMDLGENTALIPPATLTCTLSYAGNEEILLEGHLSAIVLLTCVHCLNKFKQTFEIDISETYIPAYFANSGHPKEERELNELNTFTYNGTFMDLDEIARNVLIEQIPPYPLCTECKTKL